MGSRLKTKTSPVSWRLDDHALKALVILEGQNPTKDRGEIIGEVLIWAATRKAPPATICYNEMDPKEMLHLRAELSENRRLVENLKAAFRQAKPGSKEEATRLSELIDVATQVLSRLSKHDEQLREQAKSSAQATPRHLENLERIYKKASANYFAAIKKVETEPEARERAEYWATLGNFCLLYRPNLGPDLKPPPSSSTASTPTT